MEYNLPACPEKLATVAEGGNPGPVEPEGPRIEVFELPKREVRPGGDLQYVIQIAFPEINALQYVFLGPLVGALSRAGTGWGSDKFGGGRVTFGCHFRAIPSC